GAVLEVLGRVVVVGDVNSVGTTDGPRPVDPLADLPVAHAQRGIVGVLGRRHSPRGQQQPAGQRGGCRHFHHVPHVHLPCSRGTRPICTGASWPRGRATPPSGRPSGRRENPESFPTIHRPPLV